MWMVQGSPAEEGYFGAVKRIAAERTGRYARALFSLPEDWLRVRIAMADGFDKMVEEDDRFIDAGLQKNIHYAIKTGEKGGFWEKLEEWSIYGETGVSLFLWKGLSLIAKGMVDVLRTGQGTVYEHSAAGVAKDVLRVMSILPLGEVAGVLKFARIRPLAELPAQSVWNATSECTTNSAVRALWMTRFKFFARVTDLWAEFGQMPPRNPITKGLFISEVVPALEGLGAKVTPAAVRPGSSMVEVARIAKANPNDVIMFSLTSQGGVNHTMLASAIEGSVKFYDTSGNVFRNLDALDEVYVMGSPYEAVVVHEARAMAAARSAMGAFHPLIIAEQLLLPVVNRPTGPLVIDRVRAIASEQWKTNASKWSQQPLELAEYQEETPELENDEWVSKRGRYYTYRVKPGDSLPVIAQRLYGDAKYAGRIARYNQGIVGPPPSYVIHPGQELYIPGSALPSF